MERTYDSNLILNKIFNGGSVDVRIDSNEILNAVYDDSNESLKVNIQNLPNSGTQASKEIVINTIDDEVIGKQYKTFADAFDYITTQTPSVTNTFTIRFSGIITENIIIPEFVTVVGNDIDNSKIDGSVSPAGENDLMIQNCTIDILDITVPGTPIGVTGSTITPYVPSVLDYTFSSTPTEGTYTITFAGALTTDPIPYNATNTETEDFIKVLNPLLSSISVTSLSDTRYITLNGIAADMALLWIVTNVDLDSGITFSTGTTQGTVEVQKIQFSDQSENGSFKLSYIFGSTQYDSSFIYDNTLTTIQSGITSLFNNINSGESLTLTIPTLTSGLTSDIYITFDDFDGDSNQITVIDNTLQKLNLSNLLKCKLNHCNIITTNVFGNSVLIASDCIFDTITDLSLTTFNFERCTLNDVTHLKHGDILNSIIYSTGFDIIDNVNIYQSNINKAGTITILNTGDLKTYSCAKGIINNLQGGDYVNFGDYYDNTISELVATNTQSAIDEILDMGDGVGGTFTTVDLKTVTFNKYGMITSVV